MAPQGLSYPTVAATYTQFLVITDNTPTLTHGGGKDDGVVLKVDGSSALPQGLSIAPATGTIFGTPEVTQVCKPQQRCRGPSPRARGLLLLMLYVHVLFRQGRHTRLWQPMLLDQRAPTSLLQSIHVTEKMHCVRCA